LRPLTDELPRLSLGVREVAEALALLGQLHKGRNRRPLADTLSQLLERTRAHAGLAFWSSGEQALANVLHLADLARRFEAGGATSFRAFVDQLWDEAEEGEAEEARVVEEGTEGVRLMTVHRAKGLEFPVVILADLTAKMTTTQPQRHVDTRARLWAEPLAGCAPWELLDHREEALARDREESLRLAYVAATRARDLLVVPAVGDGPREGWLEVLNPVIFPKRGTERTPKPAPACPPICTNQRSAATRWSGGIRRSCRWRRKRTSPFAGSPSSRKIRGAKRRGEARRWRRAGRRRGRRALLGGKRRLSS
jgi:ATP-dependent helicase/nuclease subunit A